MSFSGELAGLLPADIPHRDRLIEKAALHLDRIAEANRSFNLTRIVSTREAVIKHVLDSVLPWALFEGATHVLDAGTGAGFPGIPLSVVLPDVQFVLAESIGKKARFVEAFVAESGLTNVEVRAERAEEILTKAENRFVLTGRAVAPIEKAATLFGPGLRSKKARALFYKGPSVAEEIAEAAAVLKRNKLVCRVVEMYELPDGLGSRSIVEMSAG